MANPWARLGRAVLVPLLRSIARSSTRTSGSSRTSTVPDAGRSRGSRTSPQRGAGSASRSGSQSGSHSGPHEVTAAEAAQRGASYAGDYTGRLSPVYSPKPDGRPDPGEVVWAWVPFEEDHSQGKDRPVLVVGRDGGHLLALMLTSKDHTRQGDRDYLDVGTGAWDREGRPSEVKLDRVLRLDESAVRREGAVLDRGRFDAVAEALTSRR